LVWDHPHRPIPEETTPLDFMEQGRIIEAEAPTVWVGATPMGLMASPPPQPLQGFLQAGCPSGRPTNSVKALKDGFNAVRQRIYCYSVERMFSVSVFIAARALAEF